MDLVNCTPFQFNYDPLVPGGLCRFSVPKFALASAIANAILDLIPLILAQKVIWGLRMSLTKRLGVSFIFLVGILGFASSIVRIFFAVRFISSNDTTFYFSIMALCSLCEVSCANIILCVPFAPKVIKRLKETRVITGMKSYFSTSSHAGYINNSRAFSEAHELSRTPSSRDQRLLRLTGSGDATVSD